MDPEVWFRIVHAPKNGHISASVAAYREQTVEIAFGPVNPRRPSRSLPVLLSSGIPPPGRPNPYLNFLSTRFPLLMTADVLAWLPLLQAVHRRARGNAPLLCVAPRCRLRRAHRAPRWPAPPGNVLQPQGDRLKCRPHGAQNLPWGSHAFASTHGPTGRLGRPRPWGYQRSGLANLSRSD